MCMLLLVGNNYKDTNNIDCCRSAGIACLLIKGVHNVQLNCCGATGPQDYLYSAWFNHTRDFTGVFVPSTCCRLLQPADPSKPRVMDENLCQVEAIVHRATMQPITQLHTQVLNGFNVISIFTKRHAVQRQSSYTESSKCWKYSLNILQMKK